MPLENKSILSSTPNVEVHDKLSEADKKVLNEIIDASIKVLTSPAFESHGKLIATEYPKLFMRAGVTATAAEAAFLPRTGMANGGYVRTVIKVDRNYKYGAYVDRNSEPNADGLVMMINGLPLKNWQSSNQVQKSCAVNTIAHEILHTLSVSSTNWDPAYTDTSKKDRALRQSRRDGTTASYVMGSLAQCSYLNSISRVSTQLINRCVPVWYYYEPPKPATASKPGKQESSGFANRRCDDFAENDVVQL